MITVCQRWVHFRINQLFLLLNNLVTANMYFIYHCLLDRTKTLDRFGRALLHLVFDWRGWQHFFFDYRHKVLVLTCSRQHKLLVLDDSFLHARNKGCLPDLILDCLFHI